MPYKGPLAPIVYQLVGGLRQRWATSAAATIEELKTRTRFVADHAGRPAREPPARRDDHEGSAELPALMAEVVPLPTPEPRAGGAPRPHPRLRRPVQPADRAAGARGGVYSEIVGTGSRRPRSRARNPAALILSGGPASVYAEGAPTSTRCLRARRAGARHLLRHAAHGARARRRGRAHGRVGVRPGRARGGRVRAVPRPAARADVWMSHGDRVTAPPPGSR